MKKGYVELADGGTILLDEIGEMSLQTEVKLLRVLETGEFMRVGSGELRNASVRVIAATNRDLGQMVKQRHFRKDLYYRLKAVAMYIPPLRERREDIPLLLDSFIKDILEKEKLEFAGFTEDAMEIPNNYSWPGNVRELRNFTETILVLARGEKITSQMVRDHLSHYEEPIEIPTTLPMPVGINVEEAERELVYKALVSLGLEVKEMKGMLLQFLERFNGPYNDGIVYEPVHTNRFDDTDIKPLDELERETIEKALDKFRGNRRKVARVLNISERTLYRKIKEYGLA
jgi:DNA-binding NtrC family response regulator